MCVWSVVCVSVCVYMCVSVFVTHTDLTPMNFGLSPGAVQGERMNSDWTWVMDRTVAPTTQGIPRIEWTIIMIPTIRRSR